MNLKGQLDSVIPIFHEDFQTEKINQIGSGVLILFRAYYFILTAGHVIDEQKSGHLLIPGVTRHLTGIRGRFSHFNPIIDRKNDLVDVGYFKLETDFGLELSKVFEVVTEQDMFLAPEYAEDTIFSLCGYPYRKSKIENDQVNNEIFSYSALHAKPEEYKKHNCKQSYQIVMKFNRKKAVDSYSGKKEISPLPHGISGGGIFIWPKIFESLTPMDRKLTGICHTYKQSEHLFIGTNLLLIINFILHNNPELAKN